MSKVLIFKDERDYNHIVNDWHMEETMGRKVILFYNNGLKIKLPCTMYNAILALKKSDSVCDLREWYSYGEETK